MGVMGWEGHAAPLLDLREKARTVSAAVAQLVESAELCRAAGLPVSIVSCGGTGTYWVSAAQPRDGNSGGAAWPPRRALPQGLRRRAPLRLDHYDFRDEPAQIGPDHLRRRQEGMKSGDTTLPTPMLENVRCNPSRSTRRSNSRRRTRHCARAIGSNGWSAIRILLCTCTIYCTACAKAGSKPSGRWPRAASCNETSPRTCTAN